MPLNDSHPGPPPPPTTGQEVTSEASAAELTPPPLQRDGAPEHATSLRSQMHWPTVVYGAIPATLMSLPAGIGVLQGFAGAVNSGWRGMSMFVAGLSWWAGTISLWIAARSRPAIEKRTAVGLLFGLMGAVVYFVLGLTEGRPRVRINWLSVILLLGPVFLSLSYLKRFRTYAGTAVAARQPHASRPPSDKNTRRVELALKVMLFVHAFTGCLFGAMLLNGSAGLGGLGIMVTALPFALGMGAFAVWAFIRHRPCRPWAVVVFFAPAIVSNLLQVTVKLFGEPAVTSACMRATPWLPLATILLFPRTAGHLVPPLLRRRGAYITYVVIQGLMLLLWGLLLAGVSIMGKWGMAGDMRSGALFVILSTSGTAYAVLSVVSGVIGLLFGYVGLFRQREERFIGLSIAHMVLSIPVLAAGILWLMLISLVLTNPG